jgi:hypothetical protein
MEKIRGLCFSFCGETVAPILPWNVVFVAVAAAVRKSRLVEGVEDFWD